MFSLVFSLVFSRCFHAVLTSTSSSTAFSWNSDLTCDPELETSVLLPDTIETAIACAFVPRDSSYGYWITALSYLGTGLCGLALVWVSNRWHLRLNQPHYN